MAVGHAFDPDPARAPLPVGEVVETAISSDGHGTATYDRARRYRYRLSRVWEPALPRCCFVMLNPSTADALNVDPTVRRCLGFAHDWGYGAVEIVNVFAWRATDPTALRAAADPIGPGNDAAILAAASAADLVVAAWGRGGAWRGRDEVVRRGLAETGIGLSTLRLTRAGAPGHPLYVPATATPTAWPVPANRSGAGSAGTGHPVRVPQ